MRFAIVFVCGLLEFGCGGAPTVPNEEVKLTKVPAEIKWSLPKRAATTPVPIPADSREVMGARAILRRVVKDHARDPLNPWAVTHAMLALGPEVVLSDGSNAVDHLFRVYGESVTVDGQDLIRFPAKSGDIRIEPHKDLILKALAETGISPNRSVEVTGKNYLVGDLYKHSLSQAGPQKKNASFDDWDDTPWTLQGLTSWGGEDMVWTVDGEKTNLNSLTTSVVAQLRQETEFMHQAMREGRPVQKRKQGIFRYTCGGAHLLQGAAYAVARGFGTDEDRTIIEEEIPVLFFRFRSELAELDEYIKLRPDARHLLLAQRLKFTGHFLETTHKLAALNLFTPDEKQKRVMQEAAGQLIATVAVLEDLKILQHLNGVRQVEEQLFLDFVGDASHALRGLDLATGTGTVHY